MFVISNIESVDRRKVLSFYKKEIKNNKFLVDRGEERVRRFIKRNTVVIAKAFDGSIAGLIHYHLTECGHYKLGGLMVKRIYHGTGLGPNLVRYTLARMLCERSSRDIIFLIHSLNLEPRKLMTDLGFVNTGQLQIFDSSEFPHMPSNENGEIHAETFRLDKHYVNEKLALWCEMAHTMADVKFVLPVGESFPIIGNYLRSISNTV